MSDAMPDPDPVPDPVPALLPDSPAALAGVAAMGHLLPDGLVVIGADRVIRFVNTEATRILDLSGEDLVGRPVAGALPLTDRDGRDWWARSDPWLATVSHAGHGEKLLVSPRGHEVLVTARYLRAESGAVERVMIGLRDAEARQRAEREQASVLSTVAHELRAPLTSVTGFTSSLLRRWDRFSDAQKRLMIETIEADAQRLTRLITELLDISRLDSDNLTLHRGPVDLHRVLTTHVVRHELGRAAGAVRLELGPAAREHGLPEMWADTDRLEQVFFNLIENALKHGGAPVTVTLERDAGGGADDRREPGVDADPDDDAAVLVIVDDCGEGIAESDREKIFGRFWHGPANATTGLGLYVVRGLVEAHGGTVVAGGNDGGGARIIVRLPSGLPEGFAS